MKENKKTKWKMEVKEGKKEPIDGKRKKERKKETKLWLTEHSADAHHSLKDGVGEAGSEPQGDAVGKTQLQRLVLGHEVQSGVGVDAIFLESPGCSQQPLLLLLPPQHMVRPITLDLCG